MYPVSAWFKAEPTSSVTHVAYVDVWKAGRRLLGADGNPIRLAPVAGRLVEDRTSDMRLSGSVTFGPVDEAGTDLIPAPGDANAPISIYGTELRPWIGYRWPRVNPETGRIAEYVPWGRYRITNTLVGEDENGVPTVRCAIADGSWLMSRPLRNALRIPTGTLCGTAFRRLILAKDPGAVVSAVTSEFTLPSDVIVGLRDDPWRIAQDIAAMAGCEAFYDRLGRAVMAPLVASPGEVVYRYVEGEGATFTEPESESDAEDTPNVITIIGTSGGSSSAIMATAADTDPTSPTWIGLLGEVSRTIESPLVGTQTQAEAAAAAALTRSLAAHDQVRIRVVRQPALGVNDTIAVTRRQLGLRARRTVIERHEVDLLDPVACTIAARRIPTDERSAA